jgi:ribosomal protein RSM22 (predicted rRNA methylase)
MKWAILFLLLILAAIFGPFITIWALNTLFPVLAIPYTVETYFAVIAIGIFLNTNISTKKD